MDREEALREVLRGPVLGLLSQPRVEALVQASKLHRWDRGTSLERSPGPVAVYLVLEGRVALGPPPQSYSGPGEIIELSTVLAGEPSWRLSWEAPSGAVLLELDGPGFLAAVDAAPDVRGYLAAISGKPAVRRLRNDLRLLGFGPTELVRSVALLAEHQGSPSAPGLYVVDTGGLELWSEEGALPRSLGHFRTGQCFAVLEGASLRAEVEPETRLIALLAAPWAARVGGERVQAALSVLDPRATRAARSAPSPPRRPAPEIEPPPDPSLASFRGGPEEIKELERRRPRVVLQHDELDCGAACLSAIARFWGRRIDVATYRTLVHVTRDGASMLALKSAAEATGFAALGIMAGPKALRNLKPPFIALMEYHFVVVYALGEETVRIADPSVGLVDLPWADFSRDFSKAALLLAPTPALHAFPESRPSYWKYLGLLSGSWLLLAEVLGASFLVTLFGLAAPLFIQTLVDTVVPARRPELVLGASAALVALLLARELTTWVRRYLLSHVTARLDALAGSLLIQQILRLPLAFFSVRTVGDVTQRLGELARVRRGVVEQGLGLLTTALGGALNLVVLAAFSPALAAGLFLGLVPSALLILISGPPVRKRLRQGYQAEGQWQARAAEHFAGLATLRSQRAEVGARWRFLHDLDRALRLRRGVGLWTAATAAAAELFESLLEAAILGLAVTLYTRAQLSLGHLLAATMLSSAAIRATSGVLRGLTELRNVGVALDRVDDVMTAAPEEAAAAERDPELSGALQLEKVSFQYGNEASPLVLEEVSLQIRAGETVAFVGGSGSGKTTLGYLLNLLYSPTEGRILVDGIDARQLPRASLRAQIGMIVQDNSIFSGSILENITLGAGEPDVARAMEAAEAADAHGFIAALPGGYSTKLGESGEGLSGGQKQRINIARALYRAPKILVMDEATSALDGISEAKIVANLRRRRGTTIIIAHRLNTVMHADRIFVLSRGKVVEEGSHKELLARGGEYARLFGAQLAV
ncbi:MAG: peptidase domain-containing ABC transporter [Myxococcota bacterium]